LIRISFVSKALAVKVTQDGLVKNYAWKASTSDGVNHFLYLSDGINLFKYQLNMNSFRKHQDEVGETVIEYDAIRVDTNLVDMG
jgi:hypothetical protein